MSRRGIFTTIAIRSGGPVLWEKHWRRLKNAAERLAIDISRFPEDVLLARLSEQIETDGLENGRAKITISDRRPSAVWPSSTSSENAVEVSVITDSLRELSDPFRVGLSKYPVNSRSPLAGLKTTDYLEPTLAFEAARAKGFDEDIRLNEKGIVTSACFANIFWLKDDRLFTPALSSGCLAGTTREYILEKFDVSEIEAGIDELYSSQAIFLTSAGIGVVEISALGKRSFKPAGHRIVSAF